MAIKDYKKKSPATQPLKKRNTSGKSTSKKTTTAFGVGFLAGFLVAGALFIAYLNNYYSTANDNGKYSESATPEPTDNKTHSETSLPTEASKNQPKSQSIDYQFYKELKEFELPPASAADTSPQDQPDIPLISNTADEDFSAGGANDKVNEQTGEDGNDNDSESDKNKSPTRYILQAGTFTTALQAQLQRRKIIDLGYKDVHIFQAAYNNGQYHRVWLGPYSELGQAKVIGSALKAAQIEVVLRHNLRSFDRKE